MIIPDPRGLTWQDWADTVVGFSPELRNKIDPDSDWRDFAETVSQYVGKVPRPDFFDSWQAWASAVVFTLRD